MGLPLTLKAHDRTRQPSLSTVSASLMRLNYLFAGNVGDEAVMTIQLNRATSFDMACGEWECQAAMSSTPPLTSFKCFYLGRCHDKGTLGKSLK